MTVVIRLLAVPAILACLSAASLAQIAEPDTYDTGTRLPRWEVGAGIGVLHGPAYLGSSVNRTYAAPLPYGVYRGDRLHANREGVGLGLITEPRLRLDLSLSGALPVRSSGTAREGMRNLPLVIEAGPVLKYRLVRDGDRYWAVHLPVRYGVGVGRDGWGDGVGWISDPTFRVIEPIKTDGVRLDWGFDLSVKYQSSRFNNYYYGVRPGEATATRPAYRTAGGYGGATVSTGLLARYDHFVGGAFVGLSDISGARFADSPLVERRHNLFGGVAVFWVLHKSEDMVPQQAFR